VKRLPSFAERKSVVHRAEALAKAAAGAERMMAATGARRASRSAIVRITSRAEALRDDVTVP
jgi:hypothetical protein